LSLSGGLLAKRCEVSGDRVASAGRRPRRQDGLIITAARRDPLPGRLLQLPFAERHYVAWDLSHPQGPAQRRVQQGVRWLDAMLSRPSRAAMSPVNVSDPTTIHGSRQIGMAARTRGPPTGSRHTCPARASHDGSGQPSAISNILRSEAGPPPESGSRSPTRAPRPCGGAPRRCAGFLPGERARCPVQGRCGTLVTHPPRVFPPFPGGSRADSR
jgi:hypothetical protein